MKLGSITSWVICYLLVSGIVLSDVKNMNYSELQTDIALKKNRDLARNDLINNVILKSISKKIAPKTEVKWISALWAMELLSYKSPAAYRAMQHALNNFNLRFTSFQRAWLETVYCLYPGSFIDEVEDIAESTNVPDLFVISVLYLLRDNHDEAEREKYLRLLRKKFPNWSLDPLLSFFTADLQIPRAARIRNRPPMLDLLKHPFEVEKVIIYSFHRVDRSYPGLSIIKLPNGRFLRDKEASIFHIPHLACSLSGLPGYLKNGNTPQGIFSIQSISITESTFIGPTPTLQLILPFEGSMQKYFHNTNMSDITWHKSYYQALLPDSWRRYEPIYETFYAGKAGRSEIIAHGTAINPQYYAGQPYYPNTPSLGCLTAMELWSEKNGRCVYSDQYLFIDALQKISGLEGYLVLVEIDDKKQAVFLGDIIRDVLSAEEIQ